MKGISLFAGIGAEAVAMSWAGIEHLAFCEIDPWCQSVLRRHWPEVPIINDINILEALCQEFVHIAENERFLRVTQDVNDVIPPIPENGGGNMETNAVPMIENITAEESRRLSIIMGGSVPVVGSLTLSSFVWIIYKIMEMRNARDTISRRSGKLPSSEDCQMTIKSSVTTATTQRRCTGYAHIKTDDFVITGGPPCQPASIAGRRQGEADDRWLWKPTIAILRHLKPCWAVLENPPGIMSLVQPGQAADVENVLTQILGQIESLGYETGTVVFPAGSIGALHLRYRMFIIAHGHGPRYQGWEEQIVLEQCPAAERGGGSPIFNPASPRLPVWAGGTVPAPWPLTEPKRRNERAIVERFRDLDARTADGLVRGQRITTAERKRRIEALGNANPPQMYYEIFKAIMEVENETETTLSRIRNPRGRGAVGGYVP